MEPVYQLKSLWKITLVVYKTAFDAKSPGRGVHIGLLRKVISEKSKKDADAKNYTTSMGVHRNENLNL